VGRHETEAPAGKVASAVPAAHEELASVVAGASTQAQVLNIQIADGILNIKEALAEPPSGILRRHPRQGERETSQRVTFNLGLSTSHEITPYSEVYGRHPRDFHFGRPGVDAQTSCFIDVHCPKAVRRDSDDDEDDEELGSLSAKALAFLTSGFGSESSFKQRSRYISRSWARPCWFTMGALCIMMRMFGAQVCLDLLKEALVLPKEVSWDLLQGVQ